jgi:hypothetical protein
MKNYMGFMDLYNFYFARKYKYIDITDKINVLAVHHHSRLGHLLQSLDQLEIKIK